MAIPLGAEHGWVSRLFRTTRSRAQNSSHRSELPNEDSRHTEKWTRVARWAGPTTWLVPSTEAQDVAGLPRGLEVTDLTIGELRAAVELRFVTPAVISDTVWRELLAIPEEDVATSARTLQKKIRRWSEAHQIRTPTEAITLPISQFEADRVSTR